MGRKKGAAGYPRTGRRLFSLNMQTGAIAIREGRGAQHAVRTALERDDLLAALLEAEKRLSPALAEDSVPAELAIAYLADGMYRLLGFSEGMPTLELQNRLCEFILAAWKQEWFTPSPAFPIHLMRWWPRFKRCWKISRTRRRRMCRWTRRSPSTKLHSSQPMPAY